MTTHLETQFSQAQSWSKRGHKVALATVIETWGSSPRPVGAQLAIREDGIFEGSVSGGCVEAAVIDKALHVIKMGKCEIVEYGIEGDGIFEAGLACGGKIRVLIEPIGDKPENITTQQLNQLAQCEALGTSVNYEVNLKDFSRKIFDNDILNPIGVTNDKFQLRLQSPLQLFIIGAVHIAQFLVPIAKMVGFEVSLIDNRPLFGHEERFGDIKIINQWPADALNEMQISNRTAIVTLTHDDKFDIPALEVAMQSDAFYIGALGSRKTQNERNEKLAKMGYDTTRIHGPVGLSIGAKSPSEIAVSIMAELISKIRHHE